jgi:alkylated DNA repair dioxygenase AlkB
MNMQLSFAVTQTAGPEPADELEFENDFVEINRVDLDENSWIEVVPGLVRSPQNLFARLRREFSWSQRQRWMYDRKVDEPRLTASYPQIAETPSEALRTLARRLSQVYGVTYDGLWVNLYRDHRDSTPWHSDSITCKRAICTVPVLTLGHQRRFLIKPFTGGKSVPFAPASGDLLVMRGRCQVDWRHAVPKQVTAATARISVNFQSTEQLAPDNPSGRSRTNGPEVQKKDKGRPPRLQERGSYAADKDDAHSEGI